MTRRRKEQSKHDKRVLQLARQLKRKGWKVEADLTGYDEPDPIGSGGFIPDIVAKKSGATKIIEVETSDSVLRDRKQQEAFRRSAGQRKRTSFEIDEV